MAAPAMLSNFRKRFLEPCHSRPRQPFLSPSESQADASDTDYGMNDAVAMSETVVVSGCTCAMRSETDDVVESICTAAGPHSRSHARRSLPSFRSVMEVLYPPSCTPSPCPDPPSYSRSDSPADPAREDNLKTFPLTFQTTTSIEGTPLSHSPLDPLAEDPSLTGVPSQRILPRRVLLVEPNPTVGLDGDILEEQLPAYSRFDQRQPRFPAASDILGPYPPLSLLRPSAR